MDPLAPRRTSWRIFSAPSHSPFGALLRGHRIEASLTQSELAERAGINTDAISTLERGARRSPHRDTVRLLAGELGVGKTRLAQEAMVEAGSRGFVVGTGRCYQAEGN